VKKEGGRRDEGREGNEFCVELDPVKAFTPA